jgi:ribose/xylose/arabinose/galactoside ABC-type transport system permease subunit
MLELLRKWRPSGPLAGLLALLGTFLVLLWWQGKLGLFLAPSNLKSLLHDNSIPAVAALGMLLVILTGGIDLSTGSVAALSSVVAIQVYRGTLSAPACVAAGLLAGAACGLANGVMITRLGVAPFIATLGMLSMARGLAIAFAFRTRVPFDDVTPGWVEALGAVHHPWLYFSPGVWSVAALGLVTLGLLRLTVLGRHSRAVGSSEATARLCGVHVDRVKISVYTLAGLFSGWAGILLFAIGNGGDPNGGARLELDAIAAVVIGGASLSGGKGSVSGTLLGALTLGVVANVLVFFSVPVEAKYLLVGAIIVLNTALSNWQSRRARG